MTEPTNEPNELRNLMEESSQSSGHSSANDLLAAAASEALHEAETAEAETAELEALENPYQFTDEDGKTVELMTEDAFFEDLFCVVFDAPQMVDPAFVHIAIENGDPARPAYARATSDKLYGFLRDRAGKWFRKLIYADGTGVAYIMDLLPIAMFSMGTFKGAGKAFGEIRNRQNAPVSKPETEDGAEVVKPSFTTVAEMQAHG